MKKNKTIFLLLLMTFLLLPFSVKADDEISLEAVKCPVIGQKPTYVGGSTPYTNNYEERWVNLTEHRVLNSNETFQANKFYYYEFGYTLKDTYKGKYLTYPNLYEDNCAYSFGGVGMTGNVSFSTSSIAFYTGTIEDESVYESIFQTISFDVTPPSLGGNPTTIRTSSQYTINSQKWYNVTDCVEMKASDVFEANKKYRLIVNYSSLYYEDDLFNNFSTSPYYLGTSYYSSTPIEHIGQSYVTAYFYFGDKRDLEIDGAVTLGGNKAPVAGQKISDFTVTSNIPASYTEQYWTEAIKEGNMTTYQTIDDPDAVFEVGKEYRYNIYFEEIEPGVVLKSFEVINNNKNASFVSENYSYNQSYGNSADYEATYVILETGKTFGIYNDYADLLYPEGMTSLSVFPEDKDDIVSWSSSNTNVATVDDYGWVTALAPGNVTITATDSHGETATYDLVVGIPVTSITLNYSSLTMYVGETKTLTATVLPSNATDKEIRWVYDYSDENFNYNNRAADVDYETGEVTAIRPGTVRVMASASSGQPAYCDITVLSKDSDYVPVTGISLDRTKATIELNRTIKLTATVTPNNATDKIVTWTSSNTNVATVDHDGNVLGVGLGTATITAKASSGRTASATIKVTTYYGVTFFDTDGSVLQGRLTYEAGSDASLIQRPLGLRRGNTVVGGWYTEPEFINQYTFEGTVDSNLDLYAKWEEINASLTSTPNTINYGEVDEGFENRIVKTIKLKNTGNVAVSLGITNPTSDGPFGSQSFPMGEVLEAGEEINIQLIAIPSSPFSSIPGNYNGTYKITGSYVDDVSIKTISEISATIKVNKLPMHVAYSTHVQDYGDQAYVRDGAMSGTSHESKRLEAIHIKVEHPDYPGGIEYRTHVQDYGWMDYVSNDAMSGTSHESKRLEAIQIRLTGELANHFDVYYRVHAQNFGWMGWAKNDEQAGTAHYSYRLEGIEIVLVEKGENPPARTDTRTPEPFVDRTAPTSITLNKTSLSIEAGDTETLIATILPDIADKTVTWTSDNPAVATVDKNGKVTTIVTGTAKITATTKNGKKATCDVNVLPPIPGVKYTTHVQEIGWQDYVSNGTMAGTSGRSLRLEGIKIELKNMPYEGGIEYRTHVQDYGWMDYAADGEMSGTSHESKRLEAIQIRLTGEVANHYDVYYRVHAQSLGWMGWAKNDEMSGSAHYSYRLEGIEIVVVEKGQNPPARTDTRTPEPFKDARA